MTAGQLCEQFGFTKEKQWTARSATSPAVSGAGSRSCGC